ncbi:hypothetical protein [uncultured Mucilaginibacter sp.]|uniref:hypothetical protein n=1 Tax=uncultured Mucilaginibacter sp. TaxID=797541 RepID=UPI0025E0967A|nr:hypothetical protein [uncultured Mucilaginibacter sp.]
MRNIMLFIDDVAGAEALAKKALIVACQCNANLQLCNIAAKMGHKKALVSHYDDEFLEIENFGLKADELAQQLQAINYPEGSFIPVVEYCEISNFNPAIVKEMVVKHNIWLIIMDEKQLKHIKNQDTGNLAFEEINGLNCPVLIMPAKFEVSNFNKIAYVTDLRYCDFGVIRFLKVFNAALFVTHVSAPGLPDMDERYAQEILAEEVSLKTNYLKMFLRNIKSSINIKAPINKVLDSLEIKMFAIVNKKHRTFERLFDRFPQKTQVYHKLPTLIFPYLNWFNQSSFYS